MQLGDLIRATNVTHHVEDGRCRLTFKHPEKGRVFVLMVVGEEPIVEPNPLSADELLIRLGWSPPKPKKKHK